jgi:hypothetical protein
MRERWAYREAGEGERDILVGIPEGKRPRGTSGCRLEDNIRNGS